MQHFVQGLRSKGFALPTVLIASVVLLTVLAVSVTATAAVRTSLKSQYYSQLAQIAGEAGVAYAKACLAENENVPTWSDANPLQPSTDCSGIVVPGYPTTVTTNGNVRSSFSVGMPSVDADGKAVTIPNSGYVEITRTSDGSVWRTYTQPSVQAAVVPDLCSGQAASSLGWANAHVANSNVSTTNPDGAQPIAINSTNSVGTGPHFFRKDFTVTKSGTYVISSSAGATYDLFVDGELVVNHNTNITSIKNVPLDTGCHTAMVRVINGSLGTGGSELRVAIRPQGSSVPIVTTDTSWRTSAGNLKEYSEAGYYQGALWGAVRDIGIYSVSPWTGGPTDWVATAGDAGARWINTDHSYSGTNYPFGEYAYFINNNRSLWNLSASGDYTFVFACDDNCNLLVDGVDVARNSASWSVLSTATVTLTEGQHQIALELYNAGASNNASGFLLSAIRESDGVVVDRSGPHWSAASAWFSSTQSLTSYDAYYVPVPDTSDTATATVLLVGGGGAGGRSVDATRNGGGGGGGGMIEQNVSLSAGVYPVTVGAGGSGTTTPGTGAIVGELNGLGNGQNSVFSFLTAIGGGTGGIGGGGPGGVGGSGGGHGRAHTNAVGAAGLTGQGYAGGTATTSSSASTNGGAGGGGAGAAGANGTTSVGGAGGVGRISTITGLYYGGGGGGARGAGSGGAGGNGGGGGGASATGTAGVAGTDGRGGGGGGGASNANTGNGGAGGSGVVVIRYVSGSMTATGGTIATSGGYTTHTFTSSGTFTVTSVD